MLGTRRPSGRNGDCERVFELEFGHYGALLMVLGRGRALHAGLFGPDRVRCWLRLLARHKDVTNSAPQNGSLAGLDKIGVSVSDALIEYKVRKHLAFTIDGSGFEFEVAARCGVVAMSTDNPC